MPKSKRGPSLVELMRKGGEGKQMSSPPLPSWWNSAPPDAAPQQTESIAPPAPPERAPTESRPASVPDRSVTTVRHDRVVLSFSSTSAGVTVFALVVLLAGGFLAGRAVGMREGEELGYAAGVRMLRAETADEIETARASKPNSDIFSGLRSSPITTVSPTKPAAASGGQRTVSSPPKTPPTPGPSKRTAKPKADRSPPVNAKWITDYTYIIVQEFRSEDQADALEAQEFLRGHGVSTTILESRGRYKYRLVADKGFNCDDANQRKWCDEFHGKIHELGKLYVKAGGRYDLQGYQKKLTGAGW